MQTETLREIARAFGLGPNTTSNRFGSGLINSTYLLEDEQRFILQKINTEVFKKPLVIANNIRICSDYIQQHFPEFHFISPILTLEGEEFFLINGDYWRLTPFVKNSCSFDQLTKPELAYEAAKAVGAFAKVTAEIDTASIGETIPHFHNLSFRYQQFEEALANGNKARIVEQQAVIKIIQGLSHICETYESIKANPAIPLRIQHHDTKINNVLFDKTTEKSVCLCDLDTIMPGYFISDLGDMMRTYLSKANEEETDFSKVLVRQDYYNAVIEGYLSEMKDTLTLEEKKYLHYAGEFLIYMQALRFFTDYLNDDVYYATSYPENNLNRALNQLKLLEEYQGIKS